MKKKAIPASVWVKANPPSVHEDDALATELAGIWMQSIRKLAEIMNGPNLSERYLAARDLVHLFRDAITAG